MVLAKWWHREDDNNSQADSQNRIVCDLCPRECRLKEGDRGFCFVRKVDGNQMILDTYGKSTGFCIDPIERSLSFIFIPEPVCSVIWHGGLQSGLSVLSELGYLQSKTSRAAHGIGKSRNDCPCGGRVAMPKRGVYVQRSCHLGRVRD